MDNFKVEDAVAAWRRNLLAGGGMEAGAVDELESSLYDRYEEFLIRGKAPDEAFRLARARTGTDGSPVSREFIRAGVSGWSLLPNYGKVALRNLRSRGWYNGTNFACLTIGILTAAMALLYLNYETGYDGFVPDADRKFRVGMNLRSQGYSMIGFPDYTDTDAPTQLRQAEGLAEFPGVERTTQFMNFDAPSLVTANGRELATEQLLQTNTPASFCDFFGWTFLSGTPDEFAGSPSTAILTETQAARFFGTDWRSENLNGQTLSIDTTDYTITGVIADPPGNAHFDFSIALHQDRITYWGSRIYVELARGADAGAILTEINAGYAAVNPRLAENELFGGLLLQPLRSIHLNSDLLYEMKPPGSRSYLYIIGSISLIILLLTVSNYTNLSVAMSSGRSREIGMRKLFGASRGQIAGQFVLEALVLSLLTLPLVTAALWLLLPRFDALMGTEIAVSFPGDPAFWMVLLGVALTVAVLAGAYPALFLSRRAILPLFRNRFAASGSGGFSLRRAIITLQFALLIGLCSLTLFVNRQLSYLQNKDLGFNPERILYVNLTGDSSRFATFRDLALALPEVEEVAAGSILGQQAFNQTTYKLSGREDVFDDAVNIYFDYRSLDLLDIQTSVPAYVADPATAPDRLILVNETLAERLRNRYGLTDAALIGQTLIQEPEYTDEETGTVGFPYEIAGTFRDINLFSLRERVSPMFMTVVREPRYVYWAAVRYRGGSPAEIVAQLATVYDRLGTNQPFIHRFLSDNLAELYAEERRIATLSTWLSGIALLTAAIGLIALTAYFTTLRRREIGIRKILGASQWDILRRFNGEYLWLLGASLLLAVPVSWWVIDRWLSGFAYRIEITPLLFLLAAGITLLVTVLAVSGMTLRTAGEIPARVLTESE